MQRYQIIRIRIIQLRIIYSFLRENLSDYRALQISQKVQSSENKAKCIWNYIESRRTSLKANVVMRTRIERMIRIN